MKPFLHARISARLFGGDWQCSLPIHDFIDSSKAAHPTVRHRAVLHSDLGVSIVARAFERDGGLRLPGDATVEMLAVQHIEEDLGRVPTIAEWAAHLRLPARPLRGFGWLGKAGFVDDPVAACVEKWGGTEELFRSVVDWFDQPERQTGDARAGLLLQNSFGLFLSERVFGAAIQTGRNRFVAVREVGETLLLARYGSIPSLDTILRHLELRPWMYPEPTGRLHVAVSGALRRRRSAAACKARSDRVPDVNDAA